MPDDESDPNAETVFSMDPEATLRLLARNLVSSQHSMAAMRRRHGELADKDIAPAKIRELVESFEGLQKQWNDETLPALVASVQVALEVFDTFGPGMTTIDDPMEAAIWNNKWFVWYAELAGPAEID